MSKIREYMSRPYSKGDYANGIVVVCIIYAILGLVYVAAKKLGGVITFTGKINRKENGVYDVEEDEEA